MIDTAKMSERGQIIIPKYVREEIKATTNTIFVVSALDKETIIMKKLDTDPLVKEFRKLKAITDEVTLVEPEDKIWQDYWSGVYNRIERSLGWIVFSVAAILLAIYGGFTLIEEIITDATVDILLKAGLLALIAGMAILLVWVSRERLHFWQKDRYRNVRR